MYALVARSSHYSSIIVSPNSPRDSFHMVKENANSTFLFLLTCYFGILSFVVQVSIGVNVPQVGLIMLV